MSNHGKCHLQIKQNETWELIVGLLNQGVAGLFEQI